MANLESLREKLQTELEAELVDIEDESDGCGQKIVIRIVSKKFQGVPMIEQHRMVNKVMEEERKEIHAVTLKTMTPDKYAKIQENAN